MRADYRLREGRPPWGRLDPLKASPQARLPAPLRGWQAKAPAPLRAGFHLARERTRLASSQAVADAGSRTSPRRTAKSRSAVSTVLNCCEYSTGSFFEASFKM